MSREIDNAKDKLIKLVHLYDDFESLRSLSDRVRSALRIKFRVIKLFLIEALYLLEQIEDKRVKRIILAYRVKKYYLKSKLDEKEYNYIYFNDYYLLSNKEHLKKCIKYR